MVSLFLLYPIFYSNDVNDLSSNSHGIIADTINMQISLQYGKRIPFNQILGSIIGPTIKEKIQENYQEIIEIPKDFIGDGWCTDLVKFYRKVPWSGNAVDWLQYAIDAGYSIGKEPRTNAIMIDKTKHDYGHVALVVSVNKENFTILEQNMNGRGVVSQRTLPLDYLAISFIY